MLRLDLTYVVSKRYSNVIIVSTADKYGRKPIVMMSCLSLVIVGVGGAYAPNIYVLIAMKFLTGIVQQVRQYLTFL